MTRHLQILNEVEEMKQKTICLIVYVIYLVINGRNAATTMVQQILILL